MGMVRRKELSGWVVEDCEKDSEGGGRKRMRRMRKERTVRRGRKMIMTVEEDGEQADEGEAGWDKE